MSNDATVPPPTEPRGLSGRDCLDSAIACVRMSGLPPPSDEAMAILERAAREEITFTEAEEQILANIKASVRGEPLPFPPPPPENRDPPKASESVYSVEAIKLLDGLEPVRRRPTHNIISDEE